MINELTIKGLKCFEEAEFHFKNLTLLAGKNSMGKSTVIQALLAMIQKGKNILTLQQDLLCLDLDMIIKN